VPSTLADVLEEIFKEMEEQYQMHIVKIAWWWQLWCSEYKLSRPLLLPSHKAACQCASQLTAQSSAQQPRFTSDFFGCTTVLSRSELQVSCQQDSKKSKNIFHQMNAIIVAELQQHNLIKECV
jgi:hypothetical protein